MKRFIIVAAVVGTLASVGSSQAGVQAIVSGPGAAITGLYDTPTTGGLATVAVAGQPVVYVNADPLASHNVVSYAKRIPSCTTNCAPLFRSGDPVAAGGVQQMSIAGVAPGDYGFYCALHTNMRGILKVVA